jgi:hypothetical protein
MFFSDYIMTNIQNICHTEIVGSVPESGISCLNLEFEGAENLLDVRKKYEILINTKKFIY